MGASISCGVGRRALELGAGYARERNVWGQPIGAHQGIAHPLAEAKIEFELAKLMTQKAAARYEAGDKAGEASNMAKYAAAEAAIKCVDRAIQAHGGPRLRARVRSGRHVAGRASRPDRPRLARDDPQLRGRALTRLPKSY